MKIIFLLIFILNIGFTQAGELSYFSAKTLQDNPQDIPNSVYPFTMIGGPFDKSMGVLGTMGPLGTFSPVGNSIYSVNIFMSLFGNWQSFQENLTENGGPLSADGPLSILTSKGQEEIYEFAASYPTQDSIDMNESLLAGGVLHPLGFFGVLGPLSILGPLGPVGATGFDTDKSGNFLNEEQEIVTSIPLTIEEKAQDYELVELYKEKAEIIKSEDSSFSYIGNLSYSKKTQDFEFSSQKAQWITIVPIGHYTLDTYSVCLVEKETDECLIKSDSSTLTNFMVLKVSKGQKLKVRLELESSFHFLPGKKYSIHIIGSGNVTKEISGAWIKSIEL